MDPYAELDVARDADATRIKRAYRDKAKRAHPDAGGDADAFARLSTALAILSDPKRRARFDETGDAGPERMDSIDTDAIQCIAEVVVSILHQSPDPSREDALNTVRNVLIINRQRQERAKADATKAAEKAEAFRDRWTRKDGKPDVIRATLDSVAADARRQVEAMDRMLQVLARATEIIDAYEFRRDVAPKTMQPPSFFGWNDVRTEPL